METYKDISGYGGVYQISNLGNVRRKQSSGYRLRKPYSSKRGYLTTCLSLHGKVSTKSIHRLVAAAFVHKPDGCEYVNHIDGNKHNNNSLNLEWVTPHGNNIHASSMGLLAKGEAHGLSKLTADKVRQARERYATGTTTYKQIAHEMGCSLQSIQYAVSRKTWTHI